MGLLEEIAEFKALVKELGLAGSVASTINGYVYNEFFETENLGKEFEGAKDALRAFAANKQ